MIFQSFVDAVLGASHSARRLNIIILSFLLRYLSILIDRTDIVLVPYELDNTALQRNGLCVHLEGSLLDPEGDSNLYCDKKYHPVPYFLFTITTVRERCSYSHSYGNKNRYFGEQGNLQKSCTASKGIVSLAKRRKGRSRPILNKIMITKRVHSLHL